jgi:two-component system, OmpR family, osmolarity sensor histidine kinase EnvZ
MLDHQLSTFIERFVEQTVLDRYRRPVGFLDARVQVEPGVVFRFLTRQKRAYAANTYLFLWWMGGSSLVLLLVAVLFLRNQIRPILQLADKPRRASAWAAMWRSFAPAVLPRCSRRRRPSSR